jgi:hypothetical protein
VQSGLQSSPSRNNLKPLSKGDVKKIISSIRYPQPIPSMDPLAIKNEAERRNEEKAIYKQVLSKSIPSHDRTRNEKPFRDTYATIGAISPKCASLIE